MINIIIDQRGAVFNFQRDYLRRMVYFLNKNIKQFG